MEIRSASMYFFVVLLIGNDALAFPPNRYRGDLASSTELCREIFPFETHYADWEEIGLAPEDKAKRNASELVGRKAAFLIKKGSSVSTIEGFIESVPAESTLSYVILLANETRKKVALRTMVKMRVMHRPSAQHDQ